MSVGVFALTNDAPRIESILTRVTECLQVQNYEGALALFDELAPSDRETSGIRLLQASILNTAGRRNEARALTEKVLAGDNTNVDALFMLSTIEAAAGRERDQRTLLERLLKLDPNHVQALVSLGTIYLRSRSWRTAAPYFDQALAVEPENGDALLGRAQVYQATQDPQNAEMLLTKAIGLFPQWLTPRIQRAQVYRNARFFLRALADLDAAKQIAGTDYWVAVDRGAVLMDLDRKPEALEEYERAVTLDPNNFLAYVYSAGLKEDMKDYAGAEQAYNAVIRLKPDYYFAFEGLGILNLRKGRWIEARDAFLEAYNRAPKETSYALLATMTWMRAGKPTDPALKQFVEKAMRGLLRDASAWWMLRLYHDLSGDGELITRLEKEKDEPTKAQMFFYLAHYYDIRGITTLADTYFKQVKTLNQQRILEWRLNEWAFEQRNLTLDQ
jgi:tetratricopeptide (TPR) repeat protein